MRQPAFFNTISLRTQVAVATGALCAILVLGASLGAAWVGREKASELIGFELAERSVELADALDRGMFERYREIGILAGLEPLRSAWEGDPAILRRTLERLQHSYAEYAWIGFADTSGRVYAATRGMLEGQSVAQRPWFTGGLQQPFIGDVHEAVLLAKLLGPRQDSEPFRFVDVAHPVYDASGRLLGVLGAHLSWDWAADVRRSVLKADAQKQISILDAEGRVLLGDNIGETMLTPAVAQSLTQKGWGYGIDIGSSAGPSLTGFAVSRGHREYPGLGWIIIAQQPAEIAFRPVQRLVVSILTVGVLLGFLGSLLAWWLAGFLTGPISTITAQAERIGRDDGVQTLPRVGGAREVLQLSQALRSLLRRIGLAEQRLEAAERDMESQAARSREKSEDIERLRRLANTDPLTGLLNRRAFLEAAGRELAVARRYGRKLALVVADIDHFKTVNDRYGHAAGDVAIREVASRLLQVARDTDLVARFGGEEFVVLLMESDIAAGTAYAERVRSMIMAARIPIDGARDIRLTISLGCTVLDAADRDVQDAIDRADGALYKAKSAGRNRVRVSLAGQTSAVG
ncbi:MAG: diguanylate cyclase [Ferrovibrio sp.]|uniref:sensor domain-containing diguanylate cyclase n=1 Tax=Ferrovibrio sp. TaxID=1917215 RepID=UPI00391A4A57